MDHDQYCREVEAHLRRRNDGHLVRIVGPGFELVRDWAARGIPLRIVQRGIDRHVDRSAARGPRRRPVRIDFCEADVLDAFDEWRRAVGAFHVSEGRGDTGAARSRSRPRRSLAAHIDRVVGRLVARPTDPDTPGVMAAVSHTLERLDALRDESVNARGAARATVLEELSQLDAALVAAARQDAPADVCRMLAEEAGGDLAAFRGRMDPEVYERALQAATDRLLRDRWALPTVSYEP